MNQPAMPRTMPRIEKRVPAPPARDSGWATLPADRSFKVLQPSRTPAQLSLFPPGLATRTGR
jgi:hypothetical protein